MCNIMLYRIRFFSSFCDSIYCKSEFEKVCETDKMDNYGPDKPIYIVTDDTYTHAIILNTATPHLDIPKENVVGLACEPPPFLGINHYFTTYAEKHISKYFIGDSSNKRPFINEYAFLWHNRPPSIIPNKSNTMSIMVSHKHQAPGHVYRHKLVQSILNSDLDIHIYGNGCRYYPNDSRIKGEFLENEPYETYKFHICIENFSVPHYTSEKYTNTILSGTTPLYLGAKNPLFPEYTIKLTGDVDNDMQIIRKIYQDPEKYRCIINQEVVRPRLNLLKHLDTIFSQEVQD